MKNMGDKMTDQELDEMLDAADTKHDGMVNYTGLQFFFSNFEKLFSNVVGIMFMSKESI